MPQIVELPDDVIGPCEVCKAPASNKCSACGDVVYCSKDHQKQDWKKHKLACRPYEIKTSPDLGRVLVASRDLDPGTKVLIEAPLVLGPKLHVSYDVYPEVGCCLGCYRPVTFDTENRCPRCFWPCCSDCPGEARRHAPECLVLQLIDGRRLLMDGPRYEIITPLRCLLLQRRNPRKWQELLEIDAHMADRGKGTEAYIETQDRVVSVLRDRYLNNLGRLQKPDGQAVLEDCSNETLHKICGILDVNATEIRLPHGSEVLALYPTACLMQHSCVPNTKHTFETDIGSKYRISVTTERHVKKGERLTTMRSHALWGTQARREHLKATKYITCKCQRCADPTELGTFLSAMRCLGTQILQEGAQGSSDISTCNGIQLPVSPLEEESEWRCDRCPVVLTSAQVYDLVARIGEEVDKAQEASPSIKQLEELLTKITTFLHPHHYHCYLLKHSLVQLYGHQQGYQPNQLTNHQVDRKIEMCRELLGITKRVDPSNSRLGLYSSVLQYELHTAILLSTRRKLQGDPPTITAEELRKQSTEARSLLKQALKTLEPEPKFSAGSKMTDLITKSLKELESWMRENDIAFVA